MVPIRRKLKWRKKLLCGEERRDRGGVPSKVDGSEWLMLRRKNNLSFCRPMELESKGPGLGNYDASLHRQSLTMS